MSRIHAAKIHSATGQETVKRYISTKMARLLKYFWTSLIHSLTCAYCLSNKNFTQCVYHHQKSHLTHFQQWRNNRLRMRFWLRHPWVNAVIAVMKMIINLVNQERRRLLLYFPGEAIPLTAVFFLRHQYRQKEESQLLEHWWVSELSRTLDHWGYWSHHWGWIWSLAIVKHFEHNQDDRWCSNGT